MNSLKERIKQVEEQLNTEDNNLLNRIKRLENKRKQEQLDILISSYLSYLSDVLDKGDVEINIVQVIHNTIMYTSQNIVNICKLLGIKQSSEFDDEVTIYFITSLEMTYSEDMLRQSIKHIKNIMYPKTLPNEPLQLAVIQKRNIFGRFGKK